LNNNDSILFDWALSHKDELNLLFTQLDWAKTSSLAFKSIMVSIKLNDVKADGYANHFDGNLAIIIALSEALERYFMYQTGLSHTNGLAVHTSKEQSIINSQRELLERDHVLYHLIRSEALALYPLDEAELQRQLEKDYNLSLNVYRGHQFGDNIPLVIVARDNEYVQFSSLLGAEKEKFEREMISAAQRLVFERTSLSPFSKVPDSLFLEKSNLAHYYLSPVIHTHTTHISSALQEKCFKSCPLWVSHSTSDDLQNLIIGPIRQEHINTKRFPGITIQNDFNIYG
jgi:hypothetical protein